MPQTKQNIHAVDFLPYIQTLIIASWLKILTIHIKLLTIGEDSWVWHAIEGNIIQDLQIKSGCINALHA